MLLSSLQLFPPGRCSVTRAATPDSWEAGKAWPHSYTAVRGKRPASIGPSPLPFSEPPAFFRATANPCSHCSQRPLAQTLPTPVPGIPGAMTPPPPLLTLTGMKGCRCQFEVPWTPHCISLPSKAHSTTGRAVQGKSFHSRARLPWALAAMAKLPTTRAPAALRAKLPPLQPQPQFWLEWWGTNSFQRQQIPSGSVTWQLKEGRGAIRSKGMVPWVHQPISPKVCPQLLSPGKQGNLQSTLGCSFWAPSYPTFPLHHPMLLVMQAVCSQ